MEVHASHEVPLISSANALIAILAGSVRSTVKFPPSVHSVTRTPVNMEAAVSARKRDRCVAVLDIVVSWLLDKLLHKIVIMIIEHLRHVMFQHYFDGLVLDCGDSNALALESPQPRTNPSKWRDRIYWAWIKYCCLWHMAFLNTFLLKDLNFTGLYSLCPIENKLDLIWLLVTNKQ